MSWSNGIGMTALILRFVFIGNKLQCFNQCSAAIVRDGDDVVIVVIDADADESDFVDRSLTAIAFLSREDNVVWPPTHTAVGSPPFMEPTAS
uniref:Uncharacterized protein n=1 Tax=Plectus sambesii TaxID=2011161 RepID=A0A914USJ7_9BILA